MEVWPTFSWQAERQIKELKYPRHLRKLVSGLFWIVWGALVLFIIMIIAIFIGERH
jgi:hypothetical protein